MGVCGRFPQKSQKCLIILQSLLGYTVDFKRLLMKKYGKFAALIVVVIGTLVWLATAGMKENQTYYKTITELGQMGNQGLQRAHPRGRRRGSRLDPARRQPGAVRPGAGHDQAEGRLHRHRSPSRTPSKTARRRWPTASWTRTASSARAAYRPSAHRSTKPNRGSSRPARPLPTSTPAKQASNVRGWIWKIWVRWPSCWPSVVALYATVASVVGPHQTQAVSDS